MPGGSISEAPGTWLGFKYSSMFLISADKFTGDISPYIRPGLVCFSASSHADTGYSCSAAERMLNADLELPLPGLSLTLGQRELCWHLAWHLR